MAKGDKGLSVSKSDNFSEWYSEIVQKAELADLRYNVKGFLVFQPWAVKVMERMYSYLEKTLQSKGHEPYFFPTVIPESNLKKESAHLKGFTPEVFWVTKGGEDKLDEPLALRPTSETAFYQMFSLWIRSYRDLPFKTYQRANVFRHETKATRPFLRSREFHWIETHCVFATHEDAEKQVHEDMATTKEVLHDIFGLPFIFFERPQWDTFPGAEKTFAADVLNPDGKFVQQPSTHLISQHFLNAFDVTFKDKDGGTKKPYVTCYGPAVSRIFASIIIVHGDDKGLRLPWALTPYHVVVVPIRSDEKLVSYSTKVAQQLRKAFPELSIYVDSSGKSPGEKFNHWELKGVPLRLDIGEQEMKSKGVSLFRRDLNTKSTLSLSRLNGSIKAIAREFDSNLIKQADSVFENRTKSVSSMDELVRVIEEGSVARCMFCSINKDGEGCAEKIHEKTGAFVRGKKLEKEVVRGNCIVCGEKAHDVVYVGRSY